MSQPFCKSMICCVALISLFHFSKELLQLQTAGARNFNQYRNKEKPVLSGITKLYLFWNLIYKRKLIPILPVEKTRVMSAAEIIQEQSGSGNVVTSPPIAPCLGRGSFPGAEIDLSSTKKSASTIAKVLLYYLFNSHLNVTWSFELLVESYCIGGIKTNQKGRPKCHSWAKSKW